MTQVDHRQLAKALAADLVARYGDGVRLVGLCGSAARGEATPWSDIDLVVVTRAGTPLQSQSRMLQGLVVSMGVIGEGELEALLREPGLRWPFWMGQIDALEMLAGDPQRVRQWRDLGLSSPEAAFHRALERALPDLVFESYGRIRSCAARRNDWDLAPAAHEVLLEMKTALCLLNRRWVTRDYYHGLAQSFDWPLRPLGWEELAPKLWMARELEPTVALAGELVASYWKLLASCGLNMPNYQTVEQIVWS